MYAIQSDSICASSINAGNYHAGAGSCPSHALAFCFDQGHSIISSAVSTSSCPPYAVQPITEDARRRWAGWCTYPLDHSTHADAYSFFGFTLFEMVGRSFLFSIRASDPSVVEGWVKGTAFPSSVRALPLPHRSEQSRCCTHPRSLSRTSHRYQLCCNWRVGCYLPPVAISLLLSS